MKRLGVLVVVGFALARVAAASDDAGVASPLATGSGSRALALGRTGAAFASGADALFWNPARLGSVEQSALSLFHTNLLEGEAAYNAGFFAYPSLDAGTFGFGFQRLGVSGIQRVDSRNQLLGTFENAESHLLVGYARPFTRTVSLGAGLRIVQQSVDTASDASVGLDLGVALERPLGHSETRRIGLGINLQNVLRPQLRLQDIDVPDPRSVKLGAAFLLAPGRRGLAWLVAADLDVPERAGVRLGAGVEMTYRGLLALRAGLDRSAPTFGFGVLWRSVRFDYALVDQNSLDHGDRFSVELRLGRGVSERRLLRQEAREREVSDQLARQLEQREAEERTRARTEADAAFAAQRFDEALRSYRRVLALDPEDALAAEHADAAEREIALAAAAASMARGAVGEAAAAYQAVVDRWPNEERAVRALGEARAALQRTADRGRQVNALLKQALGAFSQNDPIAAHGALQELLRLDPQHEVAQELAYRVKASRATLGEQALARARSAAVERDYAGALGHLAEARRYLGSSAELTKLAEDWTRARAAAGAEDTTSWPIESRRPAATEKAAPLTAQQRSALDQRYREGLAAFTRGDFQQAIRSWRTVWVEAPEYQSVADYLIKACLYEGIALYSSGKYEAAIELCQRVLEIDPTNAKAKRYLQRMREEKSEMQQIGGGNGHK